MRRREFISLLGSTVVLAGAATVWPLFHFADCKSLL
jgi:hypothetical protein